MYKISSEFGVKQITMYALYLHIGKNKNIILQMDTFLLIIKALVIYFIEANIMT